jgi:hypothetical protein
MVTKGCASVLVMDALCYNAGRFKVLRGLYHAVKRETGVTPVLPPQR